MLANSRPKRTQKPTPVYEIFQREQLHNKRQKKNSMKESETRRGEIARMVSTEMEGESKQLGGVLEDKDSAAEDKHNHSIQNSSAFMERFKSYDQRDEG